MAKKKKNTKAKTDKTGTSKASAKTSGKTSAKSTTSKPAAQPASNDRSVRDHVLFLLKGGGAHATFDDTLKNWPLQFAGIRVAKFPHTVWMVLEHIRIGQWDILEFSRNSTHVSPKWPEEYWPKEPAPPNQQAWEASIDTCRKDLQAMQRLVADPKVDLCAKIPWGDGQTILREALILADHNSYHLGQLMMLRKSLGI
jgi:DinB superfamily